MPDVGDSARLLAVVAIAAADAQIAVYDSKHYYNFWRQPHRALGVSEGPGPGDRPLGGCNSGTQGDGVALGAAPRRVAREHRTLVLEAEQRTP